MNKPSITFWGGVGNVTGANFLIEYNSTNILVDCGIVQGSPDSESINAEDFPYDVSSTSSLCVTHAHMDHIGRIPKLVKDGFNGTIWSTPETKEIAKIMLEDAARIVDRNAREKGVLPIYSETDVHKAISLWKTIRYHTKVSLAEGIQVELFDAGHILGSSMYLFSFGVEKNPITLLCTGDLGNSPSPLVRDTEIVTNAQYILMDSVYGDRNHETKDERDKKFLYEIQHAIERKGTVVIPAFSLERTQSIIYQLNNLIEEKIIPSVPVFLDSPLAIRLMDIYESIVSLYNDGVQKDIGGGDDIFHFPKLKETVKVAESRAIRNTPGPKIIIAGSGMSTAGRVLSHEIEYLPDSNATLLLMGYQAPGTLGRQIEDGAKKVTIDDIEVEVRARIVQIGGYSAHKDSDGLVSFVKAAAEGQLKKVFVVMGEMKSSSFLAQRLQADLAVTAIVPKKGMKIEIE